MVKLAIKDFYTKDFPVVVNDIEVKNGPMIVTYQLILKLQQQADEEYEKIKQDNPETTEKPKLFYFVLGSDLIPSLDKWEAGKEFI